MAYDAKVSDLGMSRQVDSSYYVASRMVLRWAAPELLTDSRFSTKSDVLDSLVSFGLMKGDLPAGLLA